MSNPAILQMGQSTGKSVPFSKEQVKRIKMGLGDMEGTTVSLPLDGKLKDTIKLEKERRVNEEVNHILITAGRMSGGRRLFQQVVFKLGIMQRFNSAVTNAHRPIDVFFPTVIGLVIFCQNTGSQLGPTSYLLPDKRDVFVALVKCLKDPSHE